MACGVYNPATDIDWTDPVELTINGDNTLTKTGVNNAYDATAQSGGMYDPTSCTHVTWQQPDGSSSGIDPAFTGTWYVAWQDVFGGNQHGWLFFTQFGLPVRKSWGSSDSALYYGGPLNPHYFRIALEEGFINLYDSFDGIDFGVTDYHYPIPTDRLYEVKAYIYTPTKKVPAMTIADTSPPPTSVAYLPPFILEGSDTVGGVGTERFDAGNGTAYYVVSQISDSGDELRSKTIKAAYVVGKKTNASIQVYGWDVKQEINMTELEDGTRINGSTAPQALPDSTDVTQSKRQPVNVKNAVVSTVRVAGDCTGEEVMDRLDSICYEVAEEGVRR
jgi:hypothetical protein